MNREVLVEYERLKVLVTTWDEFHEKSKVTSSILGHGRRFILTEREMIDRESVEESSRRTDDARGLVYNPRETVDESSKDPIRFLILRRRIRTKRS